jgi:hypothetical protein
MATLQTQQLTITLSRMVRTHQLNVDNPLLADDAQESLEAVIQELVGPDVMIEIDQQ